MNTFIRQKADNRQYERRTDKQTDTKNHTIYIQLTQIILVINQLICSSSTVVLMIGCSVRTAMWRHLGGGQLRDARDRLFHVDDCRRLLRILRSLGRGRSEEDVTRQRSDVAQHLQKDCASRPHYRADRGLPGRGVDGAVSGLQTQVRQESSGVRRRRGNILGKLSHLSFRDFLYT